MYVCLATRNATSRRLAIYDSFNLEDTGTEVSILSTSRNNRLTPQTLKLAAANSSSFSKTLPTHLFAYYSKITPTSPQSAVIPSAHIFSKVPSVQPQKPAIARKEFEKLTLHNLFFTSPPSL